MVPILKNHRHIDNSIIELIIKNLNQIIFFMNFTTFKKELHISKSSG
jgi:hypothetical protein